MKGFSQGDRVLQATYGVGTVTSVDEHHIVIDFDEHGSRRFSTSLVKLEASDVAAPPKRTRGTTRKSAGAQKA